MRQVYLGRSGLVVSELCLGTMSFGGRADRDAARAMVDRFMAAGGTFFDTADVYNHGASEELLGTILGKDRDAAVVATKATMPMGDGPNDRSSSRRHLVRALHDSLDRLGTDRVDLYQLHTWDATTPLDETLSTLEDFVRAGKVLHVGVSNFVGWQLERAVRLQEAAGYDRLVSLQPQYSLVERNIELETLPATRENGMGVLAWSPLAAGFLTGKYTRGGDPSGKGRFARFVDDMPDAGWATLDELRAVADEHGTRPATAALAWLRSKPGVVPIVGATRPDHLDVTLAAADLDLSTEAVDRLDEVSEPRLGYPWDFGSIPGRPPRHPAGVSTGAR
ncbi:MAG: aldo/keto reductase [Actinobacteria bacterium]|nr:aldo/keto reductase [Actinomycetota bacterium]